MLAAYYLEVDVGRSSYLEVGVGISSYLEVDVFMSSYLEVDVAQVQLGEVGAGEVDALEAETGLAGRAEQGAHHLSAGEGRVVAGQGGPRPGGHQRLQSRQQRVDPEIPRLLQHT